MNATNFIKKVGAATPTFGNRVIPPILNYIKNGEDESCKHELSLHSKRWNSHLQECYMKDNPYYALVDACHQYNVPIQI